MLAEPQRSVVMTGAGSRTAQCPQELRCHRDHPRRQSRSCQGERHAIIGPNGAGKTTLFNLISGRFPITSGEILLNGQRIDSLPPHRINRMGLSRSFQITSIFHRLSVFENLRCALLWSMGYRYSFWTCCGGSAR